MKWTLPAAAILASFGMTACETLEDDIPRYRAMSCYELAREQGRWEAHLGEAENDRFDSQIDQIFSENDDEEDEAELDEGIADYRADEAKDRITELRVIRAQKQCP